MSSGSSIDAEYLAGRRFPYQEDAALVEDVDLVAATPGEDINWLEDVELLQEDGVPAVFVRRSPAEFELRTVRTGPHAGGQVEIAEGLKAGEAVVVKGGFLLKSQLMRRSIEE